MSNHLSGIYLITSKSTDKFYIGSATRLSARKNLHFRQLRANKHHNRHLQNIFNKYGEEDLIWSTLELVNDTSRLVEREQFWIDKLQPEINICKIAGSSLGVKRSQETKKKMKDAKNGKHYSFDKRVDKYRIQFCINTKEYYFGSYSTENECIEKVNFLSTLTDEEKLKYWDNNYNRKINSKGYTFNKQRNKYQVRFTIEGKEKYFGCYETEEEAINKVNEIKQNLL